MRPSGSAALGSSDRGRRRRDGQIVFGLPSVLLVAWPLGVVADPALADPALAEPELANASVAEPFVAESSAVKSSVADPSVAAFDRRRDRRASGTAGEGDLSEALRWMRDTGSGPLVRGYEGRIQADPSILPKLLGRKRSRREQASVGCRDALDDDASSLYPANEEGWVHKACLESEFDQEEVSGYRSLGRIRLSPKDVEPWIQQAAEASTVPAGVLRVIVTYLSGHHPHAISRDGHVGLMQLREDLLLEQGIHIRAKDLLDPRQNIFAGAEYVRRLTFTYKELRLALGAYLDGPHAILKAGGLPKDRRTLSWVREAMRESETERDRFPWAQGAKDMAFVWTWMD